MLGLRINRTMDLYRVVEYALSISVSNTSFYAIIRMLLKMIVSVLMFEIVFCVMMMMELVYGILGSCSGGRVGGSKCRARLSW